MIEETEVSCPYCGETITVLIDASAASQRYVEDCFVCCQPILLDIGIDADGVLETIEARPENE